ncbi:MAG: phosphoribosylamine--glycine ligase [Gemmatimonadota bacterium]
MKVLVVGKGGREHALAWKIARSPRVKKLYAAPGSPGIATVAECLPSFRVDTSASDPGKLQAEIDRLRDFALRERIDLTVVGPEDALAGGLVDTFEAAGLTVFGPTREAARLESDKVFSKQLMADIGVPTAAHRSFTDSAAAKEYVRQQGAPIVIKASGLAAGKGAVVCHTVEEALEALAQIMDSRVFGSAGAEVVVEEFMTGEEASLFAITDGTDFVCLVPAQDHKAIGDGDTGPNTGGMGAYAPAPVMTPELIRAAEEQVVGPVLAEMQRRGTPYRGVLYCGLMISDGRPRVVEFNCRFGDPEAQVVLPLLRSDLVDLLEAAATGTLGKLAVDVNVDGACVCVVLASGGYPGSYEKGREIRGLPWFDGRDEVVAFHAGTALDGERLVTAGGRVLGITALADNIRGAVDRAYEAVGHVSFDGMYCRRDIGHRALARLD